MFRQSFSPFCKILVKERGSLRETLHLFVPLVAIESIPRRFLRIGRMSLHKLNER